MAQVLECFPNPLTLILNRPGGDAAEVRIFVGVSLRTALGHNPRRDGIGGNVKNRWYIPGGQGMIRFDLHIE